MISGFRLRSWLRLGRQGCGRLRRGMVPEEPVQQPSGGITRQDQRNGRGDQRYDERYQECKIIPGTPGVFSPMAPWPAIRKARAMLRMVWSV